MDGSRVEEADDPEEMKIVIESFYETFVKYLNPEVIINYSSWICEHKSHFVKPNSSREAAVKDLIGWILDGDVCETAVPQFIATLQRFNPETDHLHPAIMGGTEEEQLQMSQNMKFLISTLDGSLIKKLSLHDMDNVLNSMLDQRIITEKICQQLKGIENPQKCCLEMMKKVKRKSDWPLVFFSALRTIANPNLLPSFDNGQQNRATQETISYQPEMDKNNAFQSKQYALADTFNEFADILDDVSVSQMSSHISSMHSIVYMTEEQKQSPEIKMLLDVGNIDAEAISSDPKYKNQNARRQLVALEPSDEEDVEGDSNMADCEVTPTLNLREYQKELAENALKGRNTIICAPTGSGKTRVATHIILSHLQGNENTNRKIAFLARTVPLVMQQCKSLKKYLPKNFEVTSLTGDSEYSMHLHMILKDNDVIVMTPRILENHLKTKCLPHLGVFSMLIFDECHHTRKGEPYNTLMYSYLNTKKEITDKKEKGENSDIKLPQIVGLTASISVEKAVKDDEAVKYILQVCGNLDASSISFVEKNIEELKRTVPVPEEKLQKLREVENDVAVNKIIKIMSNLEKAIVHNAEEIKNEQLDALLGKIPSDKKSQQYGQWAVKIRNVVKAFPRQENRETISSVRSLIIIADYLSAYNVALELHELVLMEHVIAYLDKCFVEFSQNEKRSSCEDVYYSYFSEFKDLMKRRLREENPNLTILKKTLSEYLIEKGGKSCGIIFVQTRALTEALASWLNTCDDENLKSLKATVFTGTGASVDEGGMTTAEQDEVLRRFNNGDIRLLVATSVGEEGIDIAECNLVIKYNHVGNEVTTVQTRGRSRKAGGMSILLAMDKIIRKEKINQEKSKMMERAITTIGHMRRGQIRKLNKRHQQQIMKEEEILQIVKHQEKSHLSRKNFKMVCLMCRKVVIDSSDIRTIFQTHHVVVNRDILKQTKTIPYKGAQFLDEIKMIGSVRCMGEPEEGKHCYNKLGSMMVYRKIPFVVLEIKNFGFDLNGPSGLEFPNKWKKVPYAIEEIGPSDFKSYLAETDSGVELDEESDDDDDDSDEDSDNDDDKGNKPPSKNDKHSSSKKQTELPSSGDPGIAGELKNTFSPRGANNPDGVSRTEPKILQDTSDSKDSGFSGTSTDRESSSSNSNGRTEQAEGHKIVIASNITKGEGLASAQLSEISSFKSDDKHHLTQVASSSMVKRSAQRIENIQFLKDTNKILIQGVSLESQLSTFRPLPEDQSLPILMSEISENDESSSSEPPESNAVSAAAACSTSTGNNEEVIPENVLGESNENASVQNKQSRKNDGKDHGEEPRSSENNIVAAEDVRSSNTDGSEGTSRSQNNIVAAVDVRSFNTDGSEETTPKESLPAGNESASAQDGQSRQNNDGSSMDHTRQPMSGLDLL